MTAKYILRFDDLSPFQDKKKWSEIETFLLSLNVKPIIAIIPDNKDLSIIFEHYDHDFWENIKNLQSLGWTIALHGYQHKLKRCYNSIVKTNSYGEICDSSYEDQKSKIESGLAIFHSHGINADIYCPPAHSFDKNTLKALSINGINSITDGFFLRNGYSRKHNFYFIPQQLWRFRKTPFGIYTICYHHNSMSLMDIEKFKCDVLENVDNIISINELKKRNLNLIDYIFSFFWIILIKTRKLLMIKK